MDCEFDCHFDVVTHHLGYASGHRDSGDRVHGRRDRPSFALILRNNDYVCGWHVLGDAPHVVRLWFELRLGTAQGPLFP